MDENQEASFVSEQVFDKEKQNAQINSVIVSKNRKVCKRKTKLFAKNGGELNTDIFIRETEDEEDAAEALGLSKSKKSASKRGSYESVVRCQKTSKLQKRMTQNN